MAGCGKNEASDSILIGESITIDADKLINETVDIKTTAGVAESEAPV